MTTLLTIGDFSRMTHLSVKALRHYHDVGLLEPAAVDPTSGYRLYQPDQVGIAQVIRRFRDLGMPLEDVKAVIVAPDLEARNAAIVAHLERMEQRLQETQTSVASLRRLLERGGPAPVPVEYRSVPPAPALAVRDDVAVHEIGEWWVAAFKEIHAALRRAGATPTGPPGALWPSEFFELESGDVLAFVPVAAGVTGSGRAMAVEVPAAELAVALHVGPIGDTDQTYGALGTFVAERELGVEGPIREYYLVSAFDTTDESRHRTEVCWPIFRTGG